MAEDNRHDLAFDERDHLGEQLAVFELVAVEALYHVLTGVHDNLARDGDAAQAVDRARIELERALILELLQNTLLDGFDRTLGVDEVVVENFLQRPQRVPGLLLERLV